MPKIRTPPPQGIMDDLLKRLREGSISPDDFIDLKHWLESEPEVPARMVQAFQEVYAGWRRRASKDFSDGGHVSERR
jgi:hypothetical protein